MGFRREYKSIHRLLPKVFQVHGRKSAIESDREAEVRETLKENKEDFLEAVNFDA